ncbi:MAG: hypothetical protein HC836_47120 [Richelia sp. RM2_1_2]|nr:hypothetical protein [Richelia sp. RM1_1_1]NJO65405.1 hypothetical protein [Richelia sp. RM2_1_2]
MINIQKFDSSGNLIESLKKEIEASPDWIQFQFLLMMNPQYDEMQRITQNQSSTRRFEALVNKQSEAINVISWQWEDVINGLSVEDKTRLITTQCIATWKHISDTCAMPFEFNDEGLIVKRIENVWI